MTTTLEALELPRRRFGRRRADIAPSDELASDPPAPKAETARLRDEVARLEAQIAEKDESIEFLRDLLSTKWFGTE